MASGEGPSYYKPLDASEYEVRLLSIDPGSEDDTINAYLSVASLDDPPEYTALSYCWGDESQTTQAYIDNTPTAITLSLNGALKYLRSEGVLKIWVDAVCINQEDNSEKSYQVGFMKNIYFQSSCTIAWLGDGYDDKAREGMRLLTSLRDGSISLSKPNEHELMSGTADDSSPEGSEVKRSSQRNPSQDKEAHVAGCRGCLFDSSDQGLLDLLSRPYWKRRWIIQEITISSRVTIVCEKEQVAFEDMVKTVRRFQQSSSWRPQHDHASRHYEALLDFRHSYVERPNMLPVAIAKSSIFHSKDPRDSIFGLLGISTDGADLVPLPRYKQDPVKLCTKLTRDLIRKYACFDLLGSWSREIDSSSALPSWLPQWLTGPLDEQIGQLAVRRSDDLRALALRTLEDDDHQSILKLEGLILGTVIASTSVLGSNGDVRAGEPSETAASQTRMDLGSCMSSYYGSSFNVSWAFLKCLLSFMPMTDGDDLLMQAMWCHTPVWTHRFSSRNSWWCRPLKKACLPFLRLRTFLHQMIILHFFCRRYLNPGLLSLPSRRRAEKAKVAGVAAVVRGWLDENKHLAISGTPLEKCLVRAQCSRAGYWLLNFQEAYSFASMFMLISIVCCTLFLALSYPAVVAPVDALIVALSILLMILSSLSITRVQDHYWKLVVKERGQHVVSEVGAKRLVVTDIGLIGWSSPSVQLEDKICLIAGCSKPLILRQDTSSASGDVPHYRIIGSAYTYLNATDCERYNALLSSNVAHFPQDHPQFGEHSRDPRLCEIKSCLAQGIVQGPNMTWYNRQIEKYRSQSFWRDFKVI